jgi:mannose-1-phosphate guanylyltransferase/phosphomannomutase
LEWIVLWLRHHGIRDIVINLSHQPKSALKYFGDGSKLGVRVLFSVEPRILGTAGGVKNVEQQFDGPFVVAYGDVLTDLDLSGLIAFHLSKGSAPHLTLSLYRAPNPWECGIVALNADSQVTRFVEKPPRNEVFSNLTNSGVLIMDRQLLDFIPPGTFFDFGRDVLPELLRKNVPVFGQLIKDSEYLIDMGTPEKYERAQIEWPTVTAAQWTVQ